MALYFVGLAIIPFCLNQELALNRSWLIMFSTARGHSFEAYKLVSSAKLSKLLSFIA